MAMQLKKVKVIVNLNDFDLVKKFKEWFFE
jgi:hypothetical protein